ncbi:MAG: HAD family hydrolase [Bacteroidota bacterium]
MYLTDTKNSKSVILTEILEKVSQIEYEGNPYAAFDLDNTLLIGDVGEAVFASLIKNELIQGFSWQDYQDLLCLNREAAYVKTVEIMDDLGLDILKKVTCEVIKSDNLNIEIGTVFIPYPKPNLVMQALILFLHKMEIDVIVVTASNQISAEIVCKKYFDIPSSNVFGVPVSYDINRILAYKPSGIPYGIGKVTALKSKFSHKPVITGGDGIWDKDLLDYTSDKGVRLWLGHDMQEYLKLKEQYYPDKNFYHIQYQQDILET